MRLLSNALIVISAGAATALLATAIKAGLEAVYGANSVDEFFIALPSVVIVVAATAFLVSRPLKKRLHGRKTPPGYRLKFHQMIVPMLITVIAFYPAGMWIMISSGIDSPWGRSLLKMGLMTAGMTAGFCWWLADIEKAAANGTERAE